MMNDRIIKALSGFYYVQTEDGVVECRARGKFRKEGVSPLVGDFVTISRSGKSGTVEEMTARVRQHETALVLMIEHTPKDPMDKQEQKADKRHQNELTEQLLARMHESGVTDTLMMGAGPWKTASCMSAYCVNAQKMADFVGMKCWENDGKTRYFSLILF